MGGNDNLLGGTGDDFLTGGAGNDKVNGGAGTDTVVETGNVNITLKNTSLVRAGAIVATDTLTGVERATLTGGVGNNVLNAAAFTVGPVTLDGGAGNDTLIGTAAADVLRGGLGNDTAKFGADDSFDGGAGIDKITATGSGAFTLADASLAIVGIGTASLTSVETRHLDGRGGR